MNKLWIVAALLAFALSPSIAKDKGQGKLNLGFDYEHSNLTGNSTWGIGGVSNSPGQAQSARLEKDVYKLGLRFPTKDFTLSGYIGKEIYQYKTDPSYFVAGEKVKLDGITYGISAWVPLF